MKTLSPNWTWIVGIFFIFLSHTLNAHPLGGVCQKTTIYPMGTFLMVEYETHFGWAIVSTLNPDANYDNVFSDKEKRIFLNRLANLLLPNLEAQINGSDIEITAISSELKLEDPSNFKEGINSYLALRLPLKGLEYKEAVFRFYDRNFLSGDLDQLNYFLGILGPTLGQQLLEDGRGIEIKLGNGLKKGEDKSSKVKIPKQFK